MDESPIKCDAPPVVHPPGFYDAVPSIVLKGHGGFRKIQVVCAPLQEQIDENDVEVEVYYCGINFTDNYLRLGIIKTEKFPVIMGSECVGVVLGIGSGVTDLRVGQRVLCLRMQGGLFRRYVQVPRSHCFLLPNYITMLEAVCLGLDFLVAHLALFEIGHMRDTDSIFVQSIAGGVGTSMVQLARTRGDNVKIFGTAAETKHENVLDLGADRVYRHQDDYVKEIRQEFPGGVDIVINSNGGKDIPKLLKLLKPFGRLINTGSNSSAIYPNSLLWGVIPPTWDTKQLTNGHILNSNRKITGFNLQDLMQAYPQKMQSIMEGIFEMFQNKTIQTRIHVVVPFENADEGIRKLCTRANTGKVLLFVQKEAFRNAAPRFTPPPDEAGPAGSPPQEEDDAQEGAVGGDAPAQEYDVWRRRGSLNSEPDLGIEEDMDEDEEDQVDP